MSRLETCLKETFFKLFFAYTGSIMYEEDIKLHYVLFDIAKDITQFSNS